MQARQLTKIFCWVLIIFATVAALALDILPLSRHWDGHRLLVPGDFLEFRQEALAVLHHLPGSDNLPYPPPFELISALFAWKSPIAGCAAWEVAGLLALSVAGLVTRLDRKAILLSLISPPTLYCLTMAQTGLFVSACLLIATGLADTLPVLAGMAAGCVVIKPQFGMLLPVIFIASRNRVAFLAAIATVLGLCGASFIIFGADLWTGGLSHRAAGAQSLINQSWPQNYQYTMVTMYMMCRSLGASLHVAGAIQAFSSLACAITVWHLWQPGMPGGRQRLVASLCLVMLATPYAYIYDLPVLALVVADAAFTRGQRGLILATILWVAVGFYGVTSTLLFLCGPIFLASIFFLNQLSPASDNSALTPSR